MKEELLKLIIKKQYTKVKKLITEMNIQDVAEILSDLPLETVAPIFRLIPKDIAVEVFAELDLTVATELLQYLTEKEAVTILNELAADDATDIIEEMPANIVDKLLKMCDDTTRKDINKLLKYQEDTAGSIMTVEYAELKEDIDIETAIKQLKKDFEKYETINTCYVVDKKRILVGEIQIKDLLFSSRDEKIKDICEKDILYVSTNTDQEEVANIFSKYDKTIMPVVDSEHRLVGIITIDDVLDVVEEEATEDMKKMAAITPIDKPYDKTGVFETFFARIPWLVVLMISATFTGAIITSFEDKLAACTALTAFIPMLMNTGGNAGGQSSVSIIRALSLNQIELKDIFKVMFKEFRISILCAIVLGICNFIKMLIFDKVSILIAASVCITLFVTVIIAKLIGCTLPIFAKKLGFDPAVMASPFITTIIDACSLLIYFEIATMIIGL
ncbi:MAG: magnesium transporter [Bacilli bacterium]|nr:magnesium transporter [Bacilli bacterium]